MAAIELNLKPDTKTLRQFGVIALIAFGAIGYLVTKDNGLFGLDFGTAGPTVAYVLWGLGAVSGLLSLVAPSLNRFLYIALIVITYPIGFVISYTVLGVFYYLIITPVALLFKVLGRDTMTRAFPGKKDSYWVEHKDTDDVGRYFKQY